MRRSDRELQGGIHAKREKKKKMQNIKIDLDILDKICSNEPYTENVVTTVAHIFARKHGLEESSQVEVLSQLDSTFSQLKKLLKKLLKSQDLFQKPCYILLKRETNWATLVVTKNEKEADKALLILYKDFTAGVANGVELLFRRVFSRGVKFTVNSEGSFPPNESAALSLKWMEMVILGLKSADRNKFIYEFSKISLASEELDVGKLKTDLKVDLVAHTVHCMLNETEVDQEAKDVIGKFIIFCKKARNNLGKQVSSYEKIMKEEMAKLEENPEYKMDEEKITNAQKELRGKLGKEDLAEMENLIKYAIPQFQNLTEEPKKKKDSDNKDQTPDEDLEEERKKRPYEVFKNCIRLVKGAEETEKLRVLLHSIEDKFGVSRGDLLEYFKAQKKEEIGAEVKSDSKECLNELISKLPVMIEKKSSRPTDSQVKGMDQLLAELAEEKELKLEDGAEEGEEGFQQKYLGNQEVLEMKKDYDSVMDHFKKWTNADVPTINSWAHHIRGHLNSYVEGIAVMDRVLQLTTGGFRMRDPQLFSVIWFLRQNDFGKLAQISTGEGKTVIIGVLSSLMVLQGNKVDVLTSNEVLAQEGVDEMKSFYKILGISVATNNGEDAASKRSRSTSDKPTPRACYSSDVVYGTITSFQFDYLRDTCEGEPTRGDRPFGIVILDEVDNLSVDNGGHIAKLAKPFPGMECLKYIYIKIWQELAKAEEKVKADCVKKLKEKGEELEGNKKKNNLEEGIKGKELEEDVKENHLKGDVNGIDSEGGMKGKDLEGDVKDDESEDEYENYQIQLIGNYVGELKRYIKSSNPCGTDLIHRHLRPYCESMLDKWIDNALFAKFECQKREMYIIKKVGKEDAIVPVDFANTGVTMENTQWSNGLHQFVQLKHNLRITCESLTSSFISNIGFIKLYKSKNIFGLTGTLGSVAAREMLQAAYNVTFKVFPRYKPYNLAMFESVVVRDCQWTNLVATEAVLEAVGWNRAVLIICKTIKEMELISKNVRTCLQLENYEADVKVKTYTDEDECAVVKEMVGPKEIIIATNIAGRGTNFKTTKELEASGGLHVIVSFLPYNKRVQDQAFGRTARQGNQGSAQLILRKQDVLEIDLDPDDDAHGSTLTMDMILEKRDEIERNRLNTIKERKLAEINFNDELFTKFSAAFREFDKNNGETVGSNYVAADLKEFWAFWLHKQDYTYDKIKFTNVTNEFDKFAREAYPILKNCEIMWNPFNEIRRGTMFLYINDLEKAEVAVRQGIEMCKDDGLCSSGYMKLFDIEIEKGAQLNERFKKALASLIFIPVTKDETYKTNAKAALEKAVVGLERETRYLSSILSPQGGGHQDFNRILKNTNGKNLLLAHLNGRLVALSTFHDHANSLRKKLTESVECETIGLAIGSRIPHHLKKLDEKEEDQKKLKEALTMEELDELQWIGLETMYALRDVHDASQKTIIASQAQIGGGLACLAVGLFFPPAMAVMSPIAGALISEGICDIVMELLAKGYEGFDVTSYVKGKCISYGIAIVTMGISALATSVKLLDKAAKACRGLADLLRKCPFLKGVCEKIAKQVERLAKFFEKLKYAAQLSKTNNAVQGFKSAVVSVGKETVVKVTMSLITEHVVTAGLNSILENLKPTIEAKVREGIKNAKLRNTLKMVKDREEVDNLAREVLRGSYGDLAGEVIQEIAFGVAKQSGNWKVKLGCLALESALGLAKIFTYTATFCKCFKLAVASIKTRAEYDSDWKGKEDLVAKIVADKVYSLVMALAGKHASTLVVGPLMSKALSLIGKNGKGRKNAKVDEANEVTLAELKEAYEALQLSPGASLEEVRKAYKMESLKIHPDKGGDTEEFKKISIAHEKLVVHLGSPFSLQAKETAPQTHPDATNPSSEDSTIPNNDPADLGNLITLSHKEKMHIIVKHLDEEGEVKSVTELGKKYKNSKSVTVGFLPPTSENGAVGHYDPINNDNTPLPNKINYSQPSSSNNCLYDSIACQTNRTPEELRSIAEKPSVANFACAIANKTIDLFNNPLTKDIFVKARSLILVGAGNSGNPGNGIKKPRPVSFHPNMDIKMISEDKNIIVPKLSFAGSLESGLNNLVPVFRAESDPNRRIGNKIFISVGPNSARTMEFLQQIRYREIKSWIKKNNFKKLEGQDLFSASGLTIRQSFISPALARKIVLHSVPEGKGRGKEVINVDINHAPNQFGVSGWKLVDFTVQTLQNGVGEGTTFYGRRNSMPNVDTRPERSLFGFKGSSDESSKLKNACANDPKPARSSNNR